MYHFRTQKGSHEQQEVQKASDLSLKYDDGLPARDSRTRYVRLERVITSWPRIPTNGPKNKDPMLGKILVISMMIIVILWFICGFVWLFMTGDARILEFSKFAVGAFVAALGYKEWEMSKGHVGSRHSSRPSSSFSPDAEDTSQEGR